MFSIFARPKPCKIMLLLREPESSWHLSKLSKNSDTTYVYVSHLVPELAEKGLVTIEPKGNKRMVKLTDKGMAVAKVIDELKTLLPG